MRCAVEMGMCTRAWIQRRLFHRSAFTMGCAQTIVSSNRVWSASSQLPSVVALAVGWQQWLILTNPLPHVPPHVRRSGMECQPQLLPPWTPPCAMHCHTCSTRTTCCCTSSSPCCHQRSWRLGACLSAGLCRYVCASVNDLLLSLQ